MKHCQIYLVIFTFLTALLAGCANSGNLTEAPVSTGTAASEQQTAYPPAAAPGYPAPDSSVQPTLEAGVPYPMPPTYEAVVPYPIVEPTRIIQTAFHAYPIAEITAKKWNPAAVLYGVPATFKMESSLSLPWTGAGWFFFFKIPDSPLEYYVLIENGKLQGMTEAQPIVVGERTLKYFPLPALDTLLDSDEVLAIYMKNGGEKYLADHPQAVLNPELLFTNNDPYPVWDIFDLKEKETATVSIFRLNALTGEVLELKE